VGLGHPILRAKLLPLSTQRVWDEDNGSKKFDGLWNVHDFLLPAVFKNPLSLSL
jgi:hypothetical protein